MNEARERKTEQTISIHEQDNIVAKFNELLSHK